MKTPCDLSIKNVKIKFSFSDHMNQPAQYLYEAQIVKNKLITVFVCRILFILFSFYEDLPRILHAFK